MTDDTKTEARMRRLAKRRGLVLKKMPSHRHTYPTDMYLLADAGTNGVVLGAGPLPGVDLDEVVAYFEG